MQDRALRGWLTVKKAAEYCGMSERTVRSWLKQGLKHSKLKSGTILVKIGWIDEYLETYAVQKNEIDKIVEEVVREMNQ